MSVCRAQWCCLVAVLAAVLALFCGPGRAAAGDDRVTAWVAAGAETAADAGGLVGLVAPVGPAGSGGAAGGTATTATAATPTVTVTVTDTFIAPDADSRPVPGCGKNGAYADDVPGLPGRARAGADQPPGLAEWGLPVTTGPGTAGLPVRIRPPGPAPAAPTPVELSVLRV
ncbi:hypothetical protein [Streptomyces sp. NPDC052042]|uniref:hypothetical protein n=1 Tax=Streptomyces sp. NPDC052042 TaxID=3365683 RepID=UPI0037D7977F